MGQEVRQILTDLIGKDELRLVLKCLSSCVDQKDESQIDHYDWKELENQIVLIEGGLSFLEKEEDTTYEQTRFVEYAKARRRVKTLLNEFPNELLNIDIIKKIIAIDKKTLIAKPTYPGLRKRVLRDFLVVIYFLAGFCLWLIEPNEMTIRGIAIFHLSNSIFLFWGFYLKKKNNKIAIFTITSPVLFQILFYIFLFIKEPDIDPTIKATYIIITLIPLISIWINQFKGIK